MVRLIIVTLMYLVVSFNGFSQGDSVRPEPPVLNLVTINETTGQVEMTWTLSPSPDVAGYIVYLYLNGAGIPIDSIFNPAANRYSAVRPFTSHFSEAYVIAAIDSSHNYSPLSNSLHTIFTLASADTCNRKIEIAWNNYLSTAANDVTGYDIMASVNSGPYYLAGHVSAGTTGFSISNVLNNSDYSFIVRANLVNGTGSSSNKSGLSITIMQPPQWINADYATVTGSGQILVSFTIDPASEINHYRLENKSGTTESFRLLKDTITSGRHIIFTDRKADPSLINTYRLSAINGCNVPVIISNPASNIVLKANIEGNNVILVWSGYRKWNGSVDSYHILGDAGSGFTELSAVNQTDTTYLVSSEEIINALKAGKVCFYIKAGETGNPYGISGESHSNEACITMEEKITVPNVFTPDGDSRNDLFRPVLTFIPREYHLVITDRQGRTLFETRDSDVTWDGTSGGEPVAEGVYLWFLKVIAPSGKSFTRTGTITVIKPG
ncbi:MAG: gliding motility-associated C-terminal domain-containing protein [Bacteroidota bacterium]|nr:gliding motility-associated C-terminal domain-containing protein [Bacteroidota bacterium]